MRIFKKHNNTVEYQEAYVKGLEKKNIDLNDELRKANARLEEIENSNTKSIIIAKKHIALWVYFISLAMSVDVDDILTDVKGMIDTMRGRVEYDM